MGKIMEMSSQWSALLLIGTTCAVLVYLILCLTGLFNGNRNVKSLLKIGKEEIELETKQGKTFKFKLHKKFWIGVAVAYSLAILLNFWFFIMILLAILAFGKLLAKVKKA